MAQLGVIWADGIWDTTVWNTAIWAQSGSPDVTAPTCTGATVDAAGTSITLAFSEAVEFGAGGNGGFTVGLSGGACTLTYSSGDGTSSLVYTTSRTVQAGESGTVAYTQPGNGVQDATGNDLASFTGQLITNDSAADTVAPTVTAVALVSATTLRISLSESVTFGAGGNAGWAVTLSGGAATLTYASGSGSNTLVYTVSRSVAASETGTYAYTQPGNGVEDSAGNDLATIASGTIANSIGGARNSARLHIWTGIGI